jgi:hypothetical protein
MGRIRVLAVVGVSAASGLLLTAPALADSTCQGTNEAAVCASGDTSGGTVRVSSDGGGVAPGGVVTVAGTDAPGGAVAAQGNSSNPEPANGWVMVSASPAGPAASCGVGGEPAAGAGCSP